MPCNRVPFKELDQNQNKRNKLDKNEKLVKKLLSSLTRRGQSADSSSNKRSLCFFLYRPCDDCAHVGVVVVGVARRRLEAGRAAARPLNGADQNRTAAAFPPATFARAHPCPRFQVMDQSTNQKPSRIISM